MTLDEAKTILATYRIGELEPGDAATRQALELAATDPELAAWWENEQAFDRAFAKKFASITPPREMAAIIMRGGATIFFARRLISETTGEELEEAPFAVQDAIDKAVPTEKVIAFKPEALLESHAAARKSKPAWWRRMAPLSLAVAAAVLVLGLFIVLSSPKLAAQSHAELLAFENHAAGRAAANAPPLQRGTTFDDLREYLAASGAPHAPKIPKHVGQAAVIGVSADTWSTHRYAYFVLQADNAKMHLFVLNRNEFPNDEVDEDPDRDLVNSFVAEVWSEGPHVFVLLRAAP